MRTTVRLPDDLLRQARAKASKEGTTLTALIERGLRLVVRTPKAQQERTYPPVSAVAGRELVDTTKTSELLEWLDEDLPIEKRR
jgi:hypothetical protein